MDLPSIQLALSSLASAADITTRISGLKIESEVQKRVVELQSSIINAQNAVIASREEQFTLQSKIRDLEKHIEDLNEWEDQKSRYLLVSPWGNAAQVYALKQSASNGEEPHFLCTNCFHNKKRVIMNATLGRATFAYLNCPACKASIKPGYRDAVVMYAEHYVVRNGHG